MEQSESQWKSIYVLGGVTTIIALVGILLDVIMGNVTGGNLSALPQTATERFVQLQDNTTVDSVSPFSGTLKFQLPSPVSPQRGDRRMRE